MNSLFGKAGILFFAGMITKGLLEKRCRIRRMKAEEGRRNSAAIYALQEFAFKYRQRNKGPLNAIDGEPLPVYGDVTEAVSDVYMAIAEELQEKANTLKGRV